MTPKKHIKFILRDIKGNLLETPKEFVDLAELWNTHGVFVDMDEVHVLVIDEPEQPDEREDDDADNGPLGDEP